MSGWGIVPLTAVRPAVVEMGVLGLNLTAWPHPTLGHRGTKPGRYQGKQQLLGDPCYCIMPSCSRSPDRLYRLPPYFMMGKLRHRARNWLEQQNAELS